jgi:hypothetical protein
MNAELAAAQVARVGPSYLYPDHAIAPGLVNPAIAQANIHQTICSPTWSTKSIRPPATYTTHLNADPRLALASADGFRACSRLFLQRLAGLPMGTANQEGAKDIGGLVASATTRALH